MGALGYYGPQALGDTAEKTAIRAAIDATRQAFRDLMNTDAAARIRSGEVVLGKTTSPRWMCQRRITCDGVRPCLAAIATIA